MRRRNHLGQHPRQSKSGAKRIDDFQVDDIACQIAHRVPLGDYADGKFNPDEWMDVKDQRKVDPFIIYAMAAAKQAIDDAGVEPKTKEEHERIGVLIGSGIGGLGGIYETSIILHEKGPRRDQPVLHSGPADQSRLRLRLDPLRAQGPEPFGGNGLLDRRACHRRLLAG